jgi:uncharacterized protein (DUF433 family)
MTTDLIHDQGRGPEIVGTRITVYNLIPHFLDATATEASICQTYGLTSEQVAAARAYILNHADTVLAEHLAIEARMSAGNPPEVIEQAKRTHATFQNFKDWLARRQQAADQGHPVEAASGGEQLGADSFQIVRESYMFEVLYKSPPDPQREASISESVGAFGGSLTCREELDGAGPGPVTLTYEFDDLRVAEQAAECLRSRGEHVDGPVSYGD